jgi:hypothetical protein
MARGLLAVTCLVLSMGAPTGCSSHDQLSGPIRVGLIELGRVDVGLSSLEPYTIVQPADGSPSDHATTVAAAMLAPGEDEAIDPRAVEIHLYLVGGDSLDQSESLVEALSAATQDVSDLVECRV